MSVDIRRFPWIRPLAADYAFEFDRLADFFDGHPSSPDAWRAAIARTQAHVRGPEAADVVEAQLLRRGAPSEAIAAARRLREPGAVAVVTGQQAGLFGGPLFTLLKAITAVQLAEQVTRDHHVQAVPVFWVDAEDHDWDEVRSCGVLDVDLRLQRISLGNPPGAHQLPVARVCLDATAETAVAALQAALPGTEFTSGLVDQLRQTYREGASMVEAFSRWLDAVLGALGLVVFDSSDPAAKPLVAPLFAAEVDHAGATGRLAADAGAALAARGYHVQVSPSEGSLALFHLDGGRQAIRKHGTGFQWGDQTISAADLRARILQAPAEFSPNVLLRPLAQDTLFPTVCYVAGPNELAYLGQLRGIYRAFGIPMPLVHQRATATLLDSNATRFLTKQSLSLEALHAQDDAVLNQLLAAQLPPAVESAMEDAARALDERMARLAQVVPVLDPTLEGAARSAANRIRDDLKKLQAKIIHAAKRKDETLRRQFEHARAQAFPGGAPQEREIGFVVFLNRFGPSLVRRLRDEVPVEMGFHAVVTI
jgi:bacillithiol biosynthesis cysteine-adding enzyme BshC